MLQCVHSIIHIQPHEQQHRNSLNVKNPVKSKKGSKFNMSNEHRDIKIGGNSVVVDAGPQIGWWNGETSYFGIILAIHCKFVGSFSHMSLVIKKKTKCCRSNEIRSVLGSPQYKWICFVNCLLAFVWVFSFIFLIGSIQSVQSHFLLLKYGWKLKSVFLPMNSHISHQACPFLVAGHIPSIPSMASTPSIFWWLPPIYGQFRGRWILLL